MRRFLAFVVAAVVAFSGFGALKWLSTEYDFGTFREKDGLRHGAVSFVNTGTEPTVINSVRTSCGCTAARWPEGEIAPGDTATVRFSYNPAGRPGRFEKTVRIYTGEGNNLTTIRIFGNVIPDSATLAATYPYSAGPLHVSARSVMLGQLDYGKPRSGFIYVFNAGHSPLRLSWGKLPEPITSGMSSDTVPPGNSAGLGLYYNSRAETELGPHQYNLTLMASDGVRSYEMPVELTVNLIPVVNITAEEAAEGARLDIREKIDCIGTVRAGRATGFRFELSNGGNSPLVISRVYSRDQNIRLKKYPRTVRPGAKATIEGSYTPSESDASGAFSKQITILSNDPVHPVENVRVTGIADSHK